MRGRKFKRQRRNVLKTMGMSGAGMALLTSPVAAKGVEKLEGVAYDLRTHEILADSQANVTRTSAGINGSIRIGNSTFPIDVGADGPLTREDTPANQRRYKQLLDGDYANQGVKSRMYLLDRSNCLAGYISTFNPNKRMKFDSVGFCLMDDYRAARNSIGGGN